MIKLNLSTKHGPTGKKSKEYIPIFPTWNQLIFQYPMIQLVFPKDYTYPDSGSWRIAESQQTDEELDIINIGKHR